MASHGVGEASRVQRSSLEKAAVELKSALKGLVIELTPISDGSQCRVDVWQPRGHDPIYSWSGPAPRSKSEIILFVSKVVADVDKLR
jgi:hypothetical protein